MPTAREAEAELSSLTGIPLVRVSTTTRTLRERAIEDGYDYWLRSGRGIRDASVQPHHGANAWFALMVQPNEGPTLVRGLRQLEMTGTTRRTIKAGNALTDNTRFYTEKPEHTSVEDGRGISFGYLIDAIVFAMSGRRRYGDDGIRSFILSYPPRIRICLSGALSAEVIWPSPDGGLEMVETYTTPGDTLPGLSLPLAANGLFDRLIEISPDHLRRVADVVGGDTDQPLLMPTGSNPAPENETAADRPLPGTDAAVVDDRPAQTEPNGSSHSHSRGEREKSQPSSESQAGQFHQDVRSDPYAKRPNDIRRGRVGRRMAATGRAAA